MDRISISSNCPICGWESSGKGSDWTNHLNAHTKEDLIQLLLQQQQIQLPPAPPYTPSTKHSQRKRNSSPIPSTSSKSSSHTQNQYGHYEITISHQSEDAEDSFNRSRSASPCNSNRFHPPTSSQSLTTLKPLSIKSDVHHITTTVGVEYDEIEETAEESEQHFDLVPVCSFSVPINHEPEASTSQCDSHDLSHDGSCQDIVLVHSYATADTTETSIGPRDLEIELEEQEIRSKHLVQEESDNATSQTSIIKYIIDQSGKEVTEEEQGEPERWILPDGRTIPVYSSFTQVRVVTKNDPNECGNLIASFAESSNDNKNGGGHLQLDLMTDEQIPPRGEISEYEESNTSSFISEDSNLRISNFIIDSRRLSPATIGDHEALSSKKLKRKRTIAPQSGHLRQYLCYECPTMQRFKSLFELIGHKVKVHPTSKESFSNIGSATFLPSSKFPVSLKYLIDEKIITMKDEEPRVVIEEEPKPEEIPSTTVTQSKEYFCVYCTFVCQNKKALSLHVTTNHQDKPEKPEIFECTTCGKTFAARTNLRKHLLVHKERKHVCTTCKKGFTSNFKLIEHVRVHTKVYPYKCNVCNKAYRTPSLLNHHTKTIHSPPAERPNKPKVEYYCGQCHKILRSKRSYTCHLQVHLEKPKKCPYCCETFIRQSVLVRHIRVSHNPQFESMESKDCPVCHKKLHPNSMIKHMRIHENQKPYSCQVCSKSFRTYANLTSHSWSHTNVDKPFKCRICAKSYLFKKTLEHHMMVHKRRTLHFVCNECGVKFTHKVNMKRHLEEHFSEKKYKCETCGKSFQRNYYLLEHERIHTGLKPFVCSICGKASTTKSNHRAHIKIHDARDAGSQEG